MLDNPDLPEETRRQLEGISTIEPEPYYVDGENVLDKYDLTKLKLSWKIKKGVSKTTHGQKEYPLEGVDGKYWVVENPSGSGNIIYYYVSWIQDDYSFLAYIPAQYIKEPSDLIEYTKVEKVAFR